MVIFSIGRVGRIVKLKEPVGFFLFPSYIFCQGKERKHHPPETRLSVINPGNL